MEIADKNYKTEYKTIEEEGQLHYTNTINMLHKIVTQSINLIINRGSFNPSEFETEQ